MEASEAVKTFIVERIVKEKPSPYLLTKIPEETSAPYRVRVRKQPYLHYEVKSI